MKFGQTRSGGRTFAVRKELLGQCAPETRTNHCRYTTPGLTRDGMVIEWTWEDRLVIIVDTSSSSSSESS